ncbi:TPA: hypothetical protein TXL57_000739 [Streptococcus suis]|nr:hypothetical protein [Streptococcus suis]
MKKRLAQPTAFCYGFEPVFLVEKNKKTISMLVAAKALSFHFFFLL